MAGEETLATIRKRKAARTKQPKLLFPAHRARRFLRKGKFAKRIERNTPIALAAVVECLSLELLGLAAQITTKFGTKRIQPRHLSLAIQLDDDFREMLAKTTMAQGGVIPDFLKSR